MLRPKLNCSILVSCLAKWMEFKVNTMKLIGWNGWNDARKIILCRDSGSMSKSRTKLKVICVRTQEKKFIKVRMLTYSKASGIEMI